MCNFQLEKFLCCLPLWSGLVLAGLVATAEAAASLLWLKSTYIIFSCVVTIILLLLSLVNTESVCYRKALFIGYVVCAIVQLPLVGLAFLSSKQLGTWLVRDECTGQAEPCLAIDEAHFHCAIAIFAGTLVVKGYIALIILSFSRQLQASMLVHQSPSKVVEGQVYRVPTGIPIDIELGEMECSRAAPGIPCDATDREKDVALQIVNNCSQHVITNPEIDDCPMQTF